MLIFDSKGNLVKILKKQADYKQILTHAFISQDLSMLGVKSHPDRPSSFLLSETTTSKSDTYAISCIFIKLQADFFSIFPRQKMLTRFLVLDLSWATYHAACRVLNKESIINYQNRMFELARTSIDVDQDKTLIVSCASHCMHRFSRALKSKNIFKNASTDLKYFAISCFALMMNFTDLKSITEIFKSICIVFKSKTNHLACQNNRLKLTRLIEERPESTSDIMNILKETPSFIKLEPEPNSDEEEETEEKVDADDFIKPADLIIKK